MIWTIYRTKIIDDYQRTINSLVELRNSIAHGDFTRGIDARQYNKYKDDISTVMEIVKSEIIKAYKDKQYLRDKSE